MIQTKVTILPNGLHELRFSPITKSKQFTIAMIIDSERNGIITCKDDFDAEVIGCTSSPQTIAEIVNYVKSGQ